MSKTTGIKGKTMPQVIRMQSAEVRLRERAVRSAAEQLAVLDTRPGNAVRERARLEKSQ